MKGPTQRTLEYLRSLGATAKVVERWNQWAGVRQDLWGADILACRLRGFDCSGVAIQCTSASNHAARVKKSLANPDVRLWLGMGLRFCVYSWGKHVIKKKPTWDKVPRITEIVVSGDELKSEDHLVFPWREFTIVPVKKEHDRARAQFPELFT